MMAFLRSLSRLEVQAKTFAAEACSRQSENFTAIDLANYLEEGFYEITQTSEINDSLVSFADGYPLDFRRWGAKFQCDS